MDAGRSLASELELPNLLQRILEAARDLTGARYAALGVLDERRKELADFITLGLSPDEHGAIGDPPHGHGILGLLIERPEPLRLTDVSQHPRSYGFPIGHPPMKSFLGAPLMIDGCAWGNLYLTEKQGGADFDDIDLETITVLADWAAIAIENASRYGEATDQRRSLERSLRVAQASMEITAAIGADTDLTRTLSLVVKRARALVEADTVFLWLRRGDELRLAAAAGSAALRLGTTISLHDSSAGEVLLSGQAKRITNISQLRTPPAAYGLTDVSSALLVPLIYRDERHGVLVALDRLGATASFDEEDQRTLAAFAASAATAVATARTVEEQRLQNSLAAAESERQRWARELHDETLQGLAGLKLSLVAAQRATSEEARNAILARAVAQLDADITGLRAIITDLRPAALDELGLAPALEALVTRFAERAEVDATAEVDLGDTRLTPEFETTAYRIAQEALNNVLKHADADSVHVEVQLAGDKLHLQVADDGRGIGDTSGEGFGLIGMHERANLAGGTLRVAPGRDGGTVVDLVLPL